MVGLARTLSVAPTLEPVTLNEQRDFMRVDFDDDDVLIRALITTAREYVEANTGRKLINQTWTLKRDAFWGSCKLDVPYPPLSSVTSIAYVDTNGDSQTVTSTVYTADTATTPGRIYLAYGQVWPTPRAQPNAVTITYVAGYGAAASSVPDLAKAAIKMLTSGMYEFREDKITGQIADNATVRRILALLRVPEGA